APRGPSYRTRSGLAKFRASIFPGSDRDAREVLIGVDGRRSAGMPPREFGRRPHSTIRALGSALFGLRSGDRLGLAHAHGDAIGAPLVVEIDVLGARAAPAELAEHG